MFRRQISYLGTLISSEGYNTNPKNILAVTSKINKKQRPLQNCGPYWDLLATSGDLSQTSLKLHHHSTSY